MLISQDKIFEILNNKKEEEQYLFFKAYTKLKDIIENKNNDWAVEKYGSLEKYKEELINRLLFEFDVITRMGFAGYFLIVADIINYCKKNNIAVGPGRGSASGCLISYLIGITYVNPLRYNLLFERFLSVDRVSMPDIDTDFSKSKRDEIKEYLTKKYGEDRVISICNFSKLKLKALIKDVFRVLNVGGDKSKSFEIANEINKLIDDNISFEDAYTENEKFKNEIDKYPEAKKYIIEFEEIIRQTGIHAAGVLITPNSYIEEVPVLSSRDKIVSGYDGKTLDDLGFLKIDLLGLNTLDIITDTKKLIKNRKGSLKKTKESEEKTYKMLSKGLSYCVFQCENIVTQKMLKQAKVQNIEEISDILSLIRPGPRSAGSGDIYLSIKNGLSTINYFYDKFNEELTKDIVYYIDKSDYVGLLNYINLNIKIIEEIKENYLSKGKLPDVKYNNEVKWFKELNIGDGLTPSAKLARETYVDYILTCFNEIKEEIEKGNKIDRSFLKHDLSFISNVCDKTKGLPLYQEQLMQISVRCAGFTKGESDNLRKAVGKKDIEKIAKVANQFINGIVKGGCVDNPNGKPLSTAYYLWFKFILPYGSYGFNLSHSISYSIITYETAWLKANYPIEFFTSCLNNEEDKDKCDEIIYDAIRNFGIRFRIPNINQVDSVYKIEDDCIIIPFSKIKGIGERLINDIIINKPFSSIYDFLCRVKISLKDFKALISIGAFDELIPSDCTRSKLYYHAEKIQDIINNDIKKIQKKVFIDKFGKMKYTISAFNYAIRCEEFKTYYLTEVNNYISNFKYNFNEDSDKIKEWDIEELSNIEKEYIGINISYNAFDKYEKIEKKVMDFCYNNSIYYLKSYEISDLPKEEIMYCVVRIDKLIRKNQYKSNNNKYVRVYQVSDRYSNFNLVVFDESYNKIKNSKINPFKACEDYKIQPYIIIKCKISYNQTMGVDNVIFVEILKVLNESEIIEKILIENNKKIK